MAPTRALLEYTIQLPTEQELCTGLRSVLTYYDNVNQSDKKKIPLNSLQMARWAQQNHSQTNASGK